MKKLAALTPLIDYFELPRPISWKDQFSKQGKIFVEIGFGLGEVLTRQARQFSEHNFIGIEENWERTYRTLKKITPDPENPQEQLNNVRILFIDARIALERLFSEKTISHIDCLFPCPWPKKSHVKNRLFSNDFLKLVNNRLCDDGILRIVTDLKQYYNWILEEAHETGLRVQTNQIEAQFDTKFERKWSAAGQKDFFEIYFKKDKHIMYPVAKDVEVKSFKLNQFNPQRFSFDKVHHEKCSVIFKEGLYDPEKKIMIVTLMVAEGHLLQPFRVVVLEQGNNWRVCKSDDQTFFPTPGINMAIEDVYQAALLTVK